MVTKQSVQPAGTSVQRQTRKRVPVSATRQRSPDLTHARKPPFWLSKRHCGPLCQLLGVGYFPILSADAIPLSYKNPHHCVNTSQQEAASSHQGWSLCSGHRVSTLSPLSASTLHSILFHLLPECWPCSTTFSTIRVPGTGTERPPSSGNWHTN